MKLRVTPSGMTTAYSAGTSSCSFSLPERGKAQIHASCQQWWTENLLIKTTRSSTHSTGITPCRPCSSWTRVWITCQKKPRMRKQKQKRGDFSCPAVLQESLMTKLVQKLSDENYNHIIIRIAFFHCQEDTKQSGPLLTRGGQTSDWLGLQA